MQVTSVCVHEDGSSEGHYFVTVLVFLGGGFLSITLAYVIWCVSLCAFNSTVGPIWIAVKSPGKDDIQGPL